METIQDTRNELFKRQELTFKLDSDTTPNFNDSKKQIAEQTKKPEENIDVHNIKSGFGNKTFTIHANIYDSKEDLDKRRKFFKKLIYIIIAISILLLLARFI
jgi:ribosomal protein S24E